MSKLLASVRSVAEAHAALAAPADVLDLKEPQSGVLGALDVAVVREIVAVCRGRCPLSATVGDLPPDPRAIAEKIKELAGAGVDYIKIGFFDARYFETCAGALAPLARRHALIGVLFADRLRDFEGPCRLLKQANFTGAMIDTADKTRGSVREFATAQTLRRFVATARELSLLCGIAGSLKREDIEPLAPLGADYLGFRTALCENSRRENPISAKTAAEVARTLSAASKLPAPAKPVSAAATRARDRRPINPLTTPAATPNPSRRHRRHSCRPSPRSGRRSRR